MKTTAIRLYGVNDLRTEEFELPEITEREVLLRVVTDSLCTSSYKAIVQGPAHKRVPDDIAENPIIIGHEMCGEIIQVGDAIKDQWKVGQKVVIQPALKLESGHDVGYSFPRMGGNSVYAIVPEIVMEKGCMIPYEGDSFFKGSLTEALGCIVRGYKGFYHTDYTNYVRTDGAKKGGKIAILGGAGPMGIGTVELAFGYAGASQVVVTDLNAERLAYAESKCTVENAAKHGCELTYLNTSNLEDPVKTLIEMSDGGFDDVFVMVPVPALYTMAEEICRTDGCINFFAGPAIKNMQGSLNLYRVHYDGIHVVGTAGSTTQDTVDTIRLIEEKAINPGAIVSHILGLGAVIDSIFAMEKPSGAKKVCYPEIDIPLVAIEDFAELGKTDPMYAELDRIVKANGGLWCGEAERYLLAHAPRS
jgi:threonine dehydrogenase-like Zn-dependent dehydrogenase